MQWHDNYLFSLLDLLYLISHYCYNVSIDSIIVFGDDYADIGMLELCGIGVAMGNAIDEVKERADIVIGSNDEDGIPEILCKFVSKFIAYGVKRLSPSSS